MKCYRKKIDKLDYKLVKIIAKRKRIVEKVKKYKKQNNINLEDKKREEQLLTKNKKLAKRLNLNPELIEDILKQIIKELK